MDILEFLTSHFDGVRQHGINARMVCPFHNDHPPGHFNMHLESGVWQCFHASCMARGSLKSFLERIERPGLFKQIEVDHEYWKKQAKISNPTTILNESVIAPYLKYLPAQLLEQGFSKKLLLAKQIGVDTENYRTTFPIRNNLGYLVGVSGRKISDDVPGPRYKLYREEFHELYPDYEFPKSKHLYNIDLVEPLVYSSAQTHPVYIVEGFKACLWMLQCGYETTLAIMGASISDTQLETITRLSSDIVLFLDNDEGGRNGLKVAGEKLMKFTTPYVVVGEKKQPDDYTPQELSSIIQNKTPFPEYIIRENIGARQKEKEN